MRIVIIEDNKSLASGIAHCLRNQGHAIDILHNGEDGNEYLAAEGADLVILDINLPGMSGLAVLRNMRKRNENTPVLLLTARTSTQERIEGLDAGADDYLIKPFEMGELEARVRALSRRRNSSKSPIQTIGLLSFDWGARMLFSGDKVIGLPRKELAAFECLLDRRGKLVSKTVLSNQIYGTGTSVDDKVIEVYISRLRKKLTQFEIIIKTARGLGYLLDDNS